jgi:hypothetical protein
VTAAGRRITDAYAKMRAALLLPVLGGAGTAPADFAALQRAFGALARHYEDAGHQAIIGRRRIGAPHFENADESDRGRR